MENFDKISLDFIAVLLKVSFKLEEITASSEAEALSLNIILYKDKEVHILAYTAYNNTTNSPELDFSVYSKTILNNLKNAQQKQPDFKSEKVQETLDIIESESKPFFYENDQEILVVSETNDSSVKKDSFKYSGNTPYTWELVTC